MHTYSGGCHCAAVRFEIDVEGVLEVEDCNCSICRKTGYLHLIRPLAAFRLLSGAELLSEYRFNTGVAVHRFCRVCGVKPFYVPRSNPDGIDINVRCLDRPWPPMRLVPFDGENWEAHAAALAHKSET